MNQSGAPGADGITAKLLTKSKRFLGPVLRDIFNASVTQKKFPTKWKTATVIPIPKVKGSQVASDQRPISLLPTASKVFEKLVHEQLDKYLEQFDRRSENQYGSRKHHSTESLLLNVTDHALKAMDSKLVTAIVLLDLSKAFDSIDYDILERKLLNLGVSEQSLEWFSSYLRDRKQFTRIEEYDSSVGSLSHGVPQGSILGPLLFSCYMNDIDHVPDTLNLRSYVDDTQGFYSFKPEAANIVKEKVDKDLKLLSEYFCCNRLLVNESKTQLLLVGNSKQLKHMSDFKINLNRSVISKSDKVRNLGVIMDENLTFKNHIDSIVSKCSWTLRQISQMRRNLDVKTTALLCNSLVFSRFLYCSSVIGSASQQVLNRLQRLQNYAARISLQAKRRDIASPLLAQLKWRRVASIFRDRDLAFVWKTQYGLAPYHWTSNFSLQTARHRHNLRRENNIHVQLFRTHQGQRTFSFRGASAWNSLPEEVKQTDSIKAFKKAVKEI